MNDFIIAKELNGYLWSWVEGIARVAEANAYVEHVETDHRWGRDFKYYYVHVLTELDWDDFHDAFWASNFDENGRAF